MQRSLLRKLLEKSRPENVVGNISFLFGLSFPCLFHRGREFCRSSSAWSVVWGGFWQQVWPLDPPARSRGRVLQVKTWHLQVKTWHLQVKTWNLQVKTGICRLKPADRPQNLGIGISDAARPRVRGPIGASRLAGRRGRKML